MTDTITTAEERARECLALTMERFGGEAKLSCAADIRNDVGNEYWEVPIRAMLAFATQEPAAVPEGVGALIRAEQDALIRKRDTAITVGTASEAKGALKLCARLLEALAAQPKQRAAGGDEREAIARIISPWAFDTTRKISVQMGYEGDRTNALAKADAILALRSIDTGVEA